MASSNPAAPVTYGARWVVPVEGPPIEFGEVTVAGGKIVAVGRMAGPPLELLRGPQYVILPGFVNAHTHLEFSDLETPLGTPGMAFPAWIRLVVQRRRELAASQSPEKLALARVAAVERGLAESLQSGTTLVGEIASRGWPREPLARSPLGGIVFQESLGLKSEATEVQAAAAREHLDSRMPDRWHAGLSPHAPYTIHPELLTALVALARERQTPLAMHLAESPEELELLATQSGPFRELLEAFAAWEPSALRPGLRPFDYLQALAQGPLALVIHGNYLTTQELAFLADRRKRMTVVYCPRTHAYFGHAPYPLAEMLRRGVSVAIGTDSRASNPDLNMLAELRHIARHHSDVAPADILRVGTLAGAQALGQGHVTGSLVPGKRADFACIEAPPAATHDPYAAIFDPGSEVLWRMLNGRVFAGSDVDQAT